MLFYDINYVLYHVKIPISIPWFERTIKYFFKLVGEKKIGREKSGNLKLLDQSTPCDWE